VEKEKINPKGKRIMSKKRGSTLFLSPRKGKMAEVSLSPLVPTILKLPHVIPK
jgi:hypothetical protein